MSFARRLAYRSVRYRRWGMLSALALFACAFFWRPAPTYHLAIEDLFPPTDPDLRAYLHSKRLFGADDLVLAAYPDADVVRESGLLRCAAFANALRQTPGVAAAICLAEPPWNVVLTSDEAWAVKARDLATGFAWAPGNRAAVVLCQLTAQDPSGPERRRTIALLRQKVLRESAQGVLAGEPAMLVDGIDFVDGDGKRLSAAAASLMFGVLLVCFRSLRWLLPAAACVVWTIYVNHFLLASAGMEMSMISSMIGSMITVIVVGATTHIPIRFRHERAKGLSREEALASVFTAIGPAVFWSMVTDACGFISLWTVDVAPVRDYGTMLAMASGLVLVAIYLIVPSLVLAGSWDTDPASPRGEEGLHKVLCGLIRRLPKYRALPFLVLLGMLAWGVVGLVRTRVETNFLANFRANTSISRSYRYLEENFGGVGVWYIVGPAPRPLTKAFLAKLDSLGGEAARRASLLGSDNGLTKSLSFSDVVRVAAASPLGGVLLWMTPEQQLTLLQTQQADLVRGLMSEDKEGKRYFRILLRAKESVASEARAKTVESVRGAVRDIAPEASTTGFYVLLGRLVENLLAGQWKSALAAVVLITLVLGVATGSARMAVIGLAPNLFPLVLVGGALGWLGIKMNMGAAMISAVSLGMTVDASLHYLMDFRRLRGQGMTCVQSLEQLQGTVGVAIFFSTFALVLGFWSLAASQFVPTIYFGVLSGLALLGGLLGNLVILPWLLIHFHGER